MTRTSSFTPFAFLIAAALALPSVARAQDPAKVAPDVYKVIFENARVRVMEVTMAAGAKTPMHSHPDHFAYGLAGGKVRFTHPDGKSIDADLNAGAVVWVPAETHTSENLGSTEVKALVVELKEGARKPKAVKPAKKG